MRTYPHSPRSHVESQASNVAGVIIFLLLALSLPVFGAGEKSRPARLILRGGAIYTMDASRSWASALAITGGSITYAGDERGLKHLIGPETRVIDLGGKMVLPGFCDSHIHLVAGGIDLTACDLHHMKSAREAEEAIIGYAAAHPQKKWITGGGWDLPLFPAGGPRKEVLDRICPDRPCCLEAADGHSAWVNSKALSISGINRRTADPPNGRIERDSATGEPTGTLRESAVEMVTKHIPDPSSAECDEGLQRALQLANRMGITSIQEAGADDSILDTYYRFARRGTLTVKVAASMPIEAAGSPDQIDRLIKKRQRYRCGNLRAATAKIFLDGVIESHTAALLEPYSDRPNDSGILNFTRRNLQQIVARLDREAFQVHIHAIGDGAIREALDSFEYAQKVNGKRDSRHHIAHLELIDPGDIARFRALGVIANFQPFWAQKDSYITEMTEPLLGPERSRILYPIGSLIRSGAIVVAGSDWNVSTLNPLEAIQVAVTRQALGEPHTPPWIPGERVDLSPMLAAYTINGAYVSGREKSTGSLEVGKSADLIVLDHNLFSSRPEEIHRAKVLLTMLDGRIVFKDKSFATGRDR